jgi:hypothetical protein
LASACVSPAGVSYEGGNAVRKPEHHDLHAGWVQGHLGVRQCAVGAFEQLERRGVTEQTNGAGWYRVIAWDIQRAGAHARFDLRNVDDGLLGMSWPARAGSSMRSAAVIHRQRCPAPGRAANQSAS